MSPQPTETRAGGVTAATEQERQDLANDGTRTTDLVGQLLLLQPLRSEIWPTENGDRDVMVTRVIEIDRDGAAGWVDHGDLPIFWGVVRRALDEQSTGEYPWVTGRIRQRPAKPNAKRNPPYVLIAPTPEETARANAVLAEWQATPAPDFEGADDGEEPF